MFDLGTHLPALAGLFHWGGGWSDCCIFLSSVWLWTPLNRWLFFSVGQSELRPLFGTTLKIRKLSGQGAPSLWAWDRGWQSPSEAPTGSTPELRSLWALPAPMAEKICPNPKSLKESWLTQVGQSATPRDLRIMIDKPCAFPRAHLAQHHFFWKKRGGKGRNPYWEPKASFTPTVGPGSWKASLLDLEVEGKGIIFRSSSSENALPRDLFCKMRTFRLVSDNT